jgi:hypothetical protein
MNSTISDDTRAPKTPFKIKSHHLLWVITIFLVATLVGVVIIASKDNSNYNVVKAINGLTDTLQDEDKATRNVVNNVGVAIEKSSRANVDTLGKVVENINAKLEAEGLKTAQAITALQIATTAGLTGVTDEVKKSSDSIKVSTDKLDATLTETKAEVTKLKDELALLRVNPTAAAVEAPAPVTAVAPVATPTDSLSLATAPGGAPQVQARRLEKSAPVETSVWKKIPAGTISERYSREDIVSKKVQLDDTDGIVVLSYRGWPSRLVGQHPVSNVIPITPSATSVAFTHPTKSFNIKVNK